MQQTGKKHQYFCSDEPEHPVRSRPVFASDFYEIRSLESDFLLPKKEGLIGFNESLCLVFVRNGHFSLDYFKKSHDLQSGYVLLDKPRYEYKIRPATGACTIFNFTLEFYRMLVEEMPMVAPNFFSNENFLSVSFRSSPAIDFLHHQILKKMGRAGKLEMDQTVFDFLEQVSNSFSSLQSDQLPYACLKKHRLAIVEQTKAYLLDHFSEDISLRQIAQNCFVSPFHLSRIFKDATSFSLFQYLQNLRLRNSELLIKNTNMPLAEVAFASGFNSLSYFDVVFKEHFGLNPGAFRDGFGAGPTGAFDVSGWASRHRRH